MEAEVLKKENIAQEGLLSKMFEMGHEQVIYCNDSDTGLKAIIAVHNTVLGPSLGGTRMWKYNTETDALNDVLRLSRGMSFKASISGLNLGGGKAVIFGDSRTDKSEALMRRFGKFVESLAGKYITAEDVGMTTKDMEYVNMETSHVAGLPDYLGGGGDPSPLTAHGVLMGMKACAKEQWGSDSLNGKRVLVQGIGHVGEFLVEKLVKEGAVVLVSDIFEDKLKTICNTYKVAAIALNEVYTTPVDIYAPCALGATVNNKTIDAMSCSIIAGSANNQLADEKIHGREVMERGILYGPDFLINAGGLINCYSELQGYNKNRATSQTENIYGTTLNILKISKEKNIPTYQVANELAIERIKKMATIKHSF